MTATVAWPVTIYCQGEDVTPTREGVASSKWISPWRHFFKGANVTPFPRSKQCYITWWNLPCSCRTCNRHTESYDHFLERIFNKESHRNRSKIISFCTYSWPRGADSVPRDNFGTVVGEDPTPYVILALWAVNGLSIVCWGGLLQIKDILNWSLTRIPVGGSLFIFAFSEKLF